MAFFDDLGKKISQAGQTAVQKTKEIADITKINSLIADETKKINENHREIGKLYVSLHGADKESAFAELIAAVRASEAKIAEYRQQLNDIKGVVRCEKCGAEVSANAAFCSSCGAPMPVVKPVEAQEPEEAETEEEASEEAQTEAFTEEGQPVEEEGQN